MSSYLILPLVDLGAGTPSEFAEVLRRVVDATDWDMKNLALRAEISRSQLYRLVDPELGSMPRNPHQVRGLLYACRLHPVLANAVMLQWQLIKRGGRSCDT